MMKQLLAAISAVAILAGAAAAHDQYRVIGTIERVTAQTLDVKQTSDKQVISMLIHDTVPVTRDGDKKKLSVAALKPGLSVVIDAVGDTLQDLSIVGVRIVPPPRR